MATLDLTGLQDLKKLAVNVRLKVGVLEDAANHETGEPVAPYAAANEFGTAHIPARPFLRHTSDAQTGAWMQNLHAALRAGRTPEDALKLLGMRMAEDVQATIKGNMPPPNTEETRRRKAKRVIGGAADETTVPGTLVDTGSLLRSIDYEVERP